MGEKGRGGRSVLERPFGDPCWMLREPDNIKDFYIWLWEYLFPNEDWQDFNLDDYEEVDGMDFLPD